MPGGEVELDVGDALGCAVRPFRFVEHPAVGQRRDDPLLSVGDRIQYGLRLGAQYAGYVDTPAPSFDVPVPSNLGEYWLVVMLDDHAEDLEHSSNWLVFARQDIEQRIALLVGGAALQDGLHVPVTVMDSAGEIEGGDDDQTIQFDSVAFAPGDFEAHRAVAFAPGRRRHGFARAAEVAATKLDVLRLK